MGSKWVNGVYEWDLTWTRAHWLLRWQKVPEDAEGFWAFVRSRLEASGFQIVAQGAGFLRVGGLRGPAETAIRYPRIKARS